MGIKCCHAEWNTAHQPPHLLCTAQNLIFLERLLSELPLQSSLLFATRFYKMHTTNSKCETADKQPCSYAGNRQFYLCKLWMLNQIIQWLLSVSAKKLQLLRGPRRLRAMEDLAALECSVIALAASVLWSSVAGHLTPQKSFICVLLAGWITQGVSPFTRAC